jgi:hypothetical protein
VIERARSRNLPEKVDEDFLRIAGIGDAVHGRVLEALRFLGLIEDDGRPTDTLIAISGAPEDEYRATLAGTVQNAYAEDLRRGVDPAQDTQSQIVEAFRRYQPRSQTSRMVMFFLAMCREAGIPVAEAPRERKMVGTPGRPRGQRSRKPPTPQKDRPQGGGTTPTFDPAAGSGAFLGVTIDDIALLDEKEFDEVWGALGKIARARARAAAKPPVGQDPLGDTEGGQI